MSSAAPLKFHTPIAEEEQARAGYYALLARLYYSGPDTALLAAITGAGEPGGEGPLAQAWSALAAAAGTADAAAAAREYDEVFVGTGKAEITPYATYYLAETGREKMLVRLKSDLATMGLAKAGGAPEPEDHIASLCEVMRHLISQGQDDAALQKQFFERYIAPFFPRFCSAVGSCGKARFYRHVSRFAQAFFMVETEVLKMF
jgi:TorA maturation chaperone TorD